MFPGGSGKVDYFTETTGYSSSKTAATDEGVAGGMDSVTPINRAVAQTFEVAVAEARKHGFHAMVVVYSDDGTYQFRCPRTNGNFVIGLLQRITFNIHQMLG